MRFKFGKYTSIFSSFPSSKNFSLMYEFAETPPASANFFKFDFSWAMSIKNAYKDFEYLTSLPR